MATNSIKRSADLNIFPINKTTFKLLEGENNRKERIEAEIESWKVRFPSAKPQFDNVMMMTLPANATYDNCLSYFNSYNLETKIIKPANTDALKEIDLLFKENASDTELIKLLKEIANSQEQKELLEASFENLQGGVMWIVFVLETFKNFYLTYLPQYINEKLTIEPVITLAEVKEQLKPILTDLYSCLYSSFVKVEAESDLEQLKTDANTHLGELKQVIDEARDKKKPPQPQENTELNALKEAWKKNFVDRGLNDREYLKNQELSVEAINEVGESLKTYDNTFSYMDSKHSPNLVKEWWGKVRPYWKENFVGKYDIVGGIEDTTLILLKSYIENKITELKIYKDAFDYMFPNAKEEEKASTVSQWWGNVKNFWEKNFNDANNPNQKKYGVLWSGTLEEVKKDLDGKEQQTGDWLTAFPIGEYPKGAEDVKSLIDILEKLAQSLFETIRKYDKQPELLLVPPTPPNSPALKPEENNIDVPPLKN